MQVRAVKTDLRARDHDTPGQSLLARAHEYVYTGKRRGWSSSVHVRVAVRPHAVHRVHVHGGALVLLGVHFVAVTRRQAHVKLVLALDVLLVLLQLLNRPQPPPDRQNLVNRLGPERSM